MAEGAGWIARPSLSMEMRPGSLMDKLKIAEVAVSNRLKELEAAPGRKEERAALYEVIMRVRDLQKVLAESRGLEG